MTMWFERAVGDVVVGAPDETGGGVVIYGAQYFDRVRQPPEIGGRELKVVDRFQGECPVCKSEVLHHRLEDDYGVAECMADGFLWYRVKPKTPEDP